MEVLDSAVVAVGDSSVVPDAPDTMPDSHFVRHWIHQAKERRAVCNDGSPAAYYIRPGHSGAENKWIVWLKGGGACNSPEECADRWNNEMPERMSSASFPAKLPKGQGIFSRDPAVNPDFHNWSMVVVKYCSSDLHGSELEGAQPAFADGVCKRAKCPAQWQFRGRTIVRSVFEDLSDAALHPSLNILGATDLMLSGSSAGSGGVRNNMNAVQAMVQQFNSATKVRAVLDASFYIPEGSEEDLTAEVIDQIVTRAAYLGYVPDPECVATYKDEPWRCSIRKFAMPFLKVPYFAAMDCIDHKPLERLFDIPYAKGADLPKLDELTEQNKKDIETFKGYVMNATKGRSGHFITQLGVHTKLNTNERFVDQKVDGMNFVTLLGNWYFQREGKVDAITNELLPWQ
jgi:O-palmitoleoyl-L-serine hydrolase